MRANDRRLQNLEQRAGNKLEELRITRVFFKPGRDGPVETGERLVRVVGGRAKRGKPE